MTRTTLRRAIFFLGLATALIHLYLNIFYGKFDPLFTLNGLGYLGLLGAFFLDVPFLRGRSTLVHIGFIGYTALTIAAYFIMTPNPALPLGIADKVIEGLLILALLAHFRLGEES